MTSGPGHSLDNDEAHRAYLAGDFARAMALLGETIARSGGSIDDRKRLALYLYAGGRMTDAVDHVRALRSLAPHDAEIPENIGVVLGQIGDLAGAVSQLREAHALAPDRANICDALAHALSRLGERTECEGFGRLALTLKDAEAADPRAARWPIPGGPPPAFDPEDPAENVIAFSLWGEQARYLDGAVRNATLSRDLFPQWTCRFYHDDTVPAAVIRQLRSLGSRALLRPRPRHFYDGLMWRFETIGDPGVRRFLVRDCDSVLNVKERVAVDAWLASERWFHTMRDYPSHTEPLLAGMWGGANGALPPLADLLRKFKPRVAPTRTYDQLFLREMVWPTARQSVLIHDSVYTSCLGSVPFPTGGELPRGWHIGQNESAIRARRPVPPPAIVPGDACRFFVAASDEITIETILVQLGKPVTRHCGGPVDLNALAQKLAVAAAELSIDAATAEMLLSRIFLEALDAAATPPTERAAALGGLAVRGPMEPLATLLRALPNSRLLYVARDPAELEFSPIRNRDGIALEWSARLQVAEKLHGTFPNRVTILRSSDHPGLARFFGLDPAQMNLEAAVPLPGAPVVRPSRAGASALSLPRSAVLPADGLPA